MNNHLERLESNDYSTQDEIKTAYRRLSRTCHPDLNKGINPQRFIDLTSSYDWLQANHKPKKRPVQDSNAKYYKQWDKMDKYNELYVHLPIDTVDQEISIYCMLRSQEFRVVLAKGTSLPARLVITNIRSEPFTLHVIGSPMTDDYMKDSIR